MQLAIQKIIDQSWSYSFRNGMAYRKLDVYGGGALFNPKKATTSPTHQKKSLYQRLWDPVVMRQ